MPNTQPPWPKSPVVSFVVPTGACITPSSDTNAAPVNLRMGQIRLTNALPISILDWNGSSIKCWTAPCDLNERLLLGCGCRLLNVRNWVGSGIYFSVGIQSAAT
jgi:hypothetical protein